MIVTLENDKWELERQTAYAKSLSAPIRNLPSEVLVEIFSHYCGQISIRDDGVYIPALRLGAVSRHWRNVAWSASRLWSTIHLEKAVESGSDVNEQVKQAALAFVLDRAKGAPLDIGLYSNADLGESVPYQTLATRAGSWRSLSLIIGMKGTINFHTSIRGKLGNLRRLDTSLDDVDDLCEVTPKLRQLNLVHFNWRDEPIAEWVKLPWANASRLEYKTDDLNTFWDLATRCSGLTSARLSLLKFSDKPLRTITPMQVVTPALKELTLELRHNVPPEQLLEPVLNMLSAPCMTHLELATRQNMDNPGGAFNGWMFEQGFHISPLLSFVSRSSCVMTLTSFSLDLWPAITTENILSIFHTLPCLKSISLREHSYATIMKSLAHEALKYELLTQPWFTVISDTLLSALCARPATPFETVSPHLGRLESLSLTVRNNGFNHRLYVEMVRSRWRGFYSQSESGSRNSLRKAELKVMDGRFPRELFMQLRHLRKAGLKLGIEDDSGDLDVQNWEGS